MHDCAGEELLRDSRGAASSHANGSVPDVGLSSELLGGFTDFAEHGCTVSVAWMFSSLSITGLFAHLLATRRTALLDVLSRVLDKDRSTQLAHLQAGVRSNAIWWTLLLSYCVIHSMFLRAS